VPSERSRARSVSARIGWPHSVPRSCWVICETGGACCPRWSTSTSPASTYPVAAGVVTAAANYAAAVREIGRRARTVVMSMGPAQPEHPSDLGKAQWLAEQVMEWAGLDLLVLRVSALFHENLLVLHGRSIRSHGVFRNSFGRGEIAWISGRDAAELGVAGLLHPERFSDRSSTLGLRAVHARSHRGFADRSDA
jgi:uncharacterized protein YbjT (DUF2867 family)